MSNQERFLAARYRSHSESISLLTSSPSAISAVPSCTRGKDRCVLGISKGVSLLPQAVFLIYDKVFAGFSSLAFLPRCPAPPWSDSVSPDAKTPLAGTSRIRSLRGPARGATPHGRDNISASVGAIFTRWWRRGWLCSRLCVGAAGVIWPGCVGVAAVAVERTLRVPLPTAAAAHSSAPGGVPPREGN